MHLSYTSISDAQACPYRFKLKYIDKIKTFNNSIDTIFGNLMHECVQSFLMHKRTKQETLKYFFRWWKTFCKIYRKQLDEKKIVTFLRAGVNCLKQVDTAFEGCEALSVEENLMLPISQKRPEIYFKGFVDLVMFKDDKLVIADLKTTRSSYMFEKYLDAMKRYQLIYYKTYYAQKHDIDINDIDVCFITLEKTPTSKSPIQFIYELAGPKKMKASQDLIDETIDMIDRQDFPRNRDACHDEKTGIKCPFFETDYCPTPT